MKEPITVTLTLNQETGEFSMNAPLHDKLLCYGILHLGLEAVMRHRIDEKRISPAPAMWRPPVGGKS